MTGALVFDFDGTIVDTETPVYESWAAAFLAAGLEPISLDTWLSQIGQADKDALDLRGILCEHLGVEVLPASIESHRKKTRDDMLHALPIREGVLEWIEAAVRDDVLLAVASSSPSLWVKPHLKRLGLDGYFPVVSCADPGIPGKPDPTVYLTACKEIGADPKLSLAIEDSPHGVSAAISAGMRCVATPGPMTRSLNFDHATIRSDSLATLNPLDYF